MPTEVESLLATYREKYEAAKRDVEFYGQMVAEIEAAMPAKRGRQPKTNGAPKTRAMRTAKSGRKKPVKAEVSAAEAVTRLLAGCKMGLPASEIIQNVSTAYGHKPNSLRTTLYNLKKSGAIVQSEDGSTTTRRTSYRPPQVLKGTDWPTGDRPIRHSSPSSGCIHQA